MPSAIEVSWAAVRTGEGLEEALAVPVSQRQVHVAKRCALFVGRL
jgi:hypothetical protein